MESEKAWQLLVDKLTGAATEEGLTELQRYLKEDSEFAAKAEMLELVWRNKGKEQTIDTDLFYNRLLQKLSDDGLQSQVASTITIEPVNRSDRRFKFYLSIAAMLVLAFLGTRLFQRANPSALSPATTAEENNVSTKKGSKSTLQLPDGTKVWLNSGSSLSYGNDFNSNLRQVRLSGEAFFDVAHDSLRPFIIHTETLDLRVLGTAFNLRAYPEDAITETSLVRGSVEVTLHKTPEKKILLKPNEKLIVTQNTTTKSNSASQLSAKQMPVLTLTYMHRHQQDSTAMEVLWTKNKLAFEGERLSEVALKLERWYGVRVEIEGEDLKNAEYTGVFSDENLSDVLYALHLTGNFQYSIKKNEVIIHP